MRSLWSQVRQYNNGYSPSKCLEIEGGMEVGATHVERYGRRRQICELYPGVLVVEGGGVHTMLSLGDGVEPVPNDWNEAFSIPDVQARVAADRFGDLVDFAALSRYFGGALPRVWSTLPRDAWARSPWTARAIEGRPMLEVSATHFTTTPRTLVCELYPGILVGEKYAVYTVVTYGHLVELLPPSSDERFATTGTRAVFAALQFGKQMSSSSRTWPPPQWERGRDLRNR